MSPLAPNILLQQLVNRSLPHASALLAGDAGLLINHNQVFILKSDHLLETAAHLSWCRVLKCIWFFDPIKRGILYREHIAWLQLVGYVFGDLGGVRPQDVAVLRAD